MSVLCTLSAPFGGLGIACSIFDGIERILYEHLDLFVVVIVAVAAVTRHAGIADEHRLRTHIFTILQEFVVAEAVGRVVAPEVVFSLTEFGFADGVFPVHPVFHCQTFNNTAAGPAHKGRFKVGDELGDILTQAVGPVMEGLLREE